MLYELSVYIIKAREAKQTDEQIKNALVATGWSETEVTASLAPSTPLTPPPPPPPPHESMRTGFLYLTYITSITILALALMTVLHIWVDNTFSTPTSTQNVTLPQISDNFMLNTAISMAEPMISSALLTAKKGVLYGSLAAIIVFYPIFMLLSLWLRKQLTTKPYVRHFRSRKIPLYLLLFLALFAILAHLVAAVVIALIGSGNSSTVVHLFVTLLVCGLIIGYFLPEVHHEK